jgi:hypothetical protein
VPWFTFSVETTVLWDFAAEAQWKDIITKTYPSARGMMNVLGASTTRIRVTWLVQQALL